MRIVLLLIASLIPSMPAMAATSAQEIAQEMAATNGGPKSTGLDGPSGVLAAAQRGDASAQFEMGILYEFGFNMPDNEVAALAWYMVAADTHPNAAKRRDGLLAKLPKEKIEAAEKLSKTLVTSPAPAAPVAPTPGVPMEPAPMTETPMAPPSEGNGQIPEMTPAEPLPEPILQPEKQ